MTNAIADYASDYGNYEIDIGCMKCQFNNPKHNANKVNQ